METDRLRRLHERDAAIWIVNADGSDPQQLTPTDPDSDNFWPRFTPDGAWILFTNCFGFDCDGGISAIRPDGTGMHPITPNSHGPTTSLSWRRPAPSWPTCVGISAG